MKDYFIGSKSPLRSFFPLIQKSRRWAEKYYNRIGKRMVINGGRIKFMDVELEFPENVGLQYSMPLFWNGPDAYEDSTSRAKLFLDIGSNIGIYSVYSGVKFPQVKIFAFEPLPKIWKKNRQFHRANGLGDEAVLNLALGDREGRQDIFLPVYDSGWEEEQTATLRHDSWQTREKNVEKIEIQCATLDTFAAAASLPAGPCLLKIDVENYEAAVLRGSRRFIASRRPWIVCEILPGQDIDPVTQVRKNNNSEVTTVIRELNYVIFAITAEGLFRINPGDFVPPRGLKDFLLVPREKISDGICFLSSETIGADFSE